MEQGSTITYALVDISNTLVDDKFLMALQRNFNLSHISLIKNSQRNNSIGLEDLATCWNICFNIANKTVEVTTQGEILTVANYIFTHRFSMNDRQLRYWLLNINMFTGALLSNMKSKQKNTCAHIYCNDLMWKRIHLMKSKSEAHHSLSTLFVKYGIPNVMVMYNVIE